MATKRTPKKRITRGKAVRLPNGAGSITITRTGEVLFKKAAPKKRKANPTKAKQPARRVLKAMATWVRSQNAAPKKKRKTNGRKRTATPRKGGRR